MSDNIRVVIDAGVLISAACFRSSVPRQAVDAVLIRGRLLVSESTLAEVVDVFCRAKFNRYVDESLRHEFLASLVHQAEVVDVKDVVTECRDPNDNKYLELAVSGQATHIVSGDSDLLAMNPFRGVSIIDPRTFISGLETRT